MDVFCVNIWMRLSKTSFPVCWLVSVWLWGTFFMPYRVRIMLSEWGTYFYLCYRVILSLSIAWWEHYGGPNVSRIYCGLNCNCHNNNGHHRIQPWEVLILPSNWNIPKINHVFDWKGSGRRISHYVVRMHVKSYAHIHPWCRAVSCPGQFYQYHSR